MKPAQLYIPEDLAAFSESPAYVFQCSPPTEVASSGRRAGARPAARWASPDARREPDALKLVKNHTAVTINAAYQSTIKAPRRDKAKFRRANSPTSPFTHKSSGYLRSENVLRLPAAPTTIQLWLKTTSSVHTPPASFRLLGISRSCASRRSNRQAFLLPIC